MVYGFAKSAPLARSATAPVAGDVGPGAVASTRIVAIWLVVCPNVFIIVFVRFTSGTYATGSGCASQRSETCSRVDDDSTSLPAACAVSYETAQAAGDRETTRLNSSHVAF